LDLSLYLQVQLGVSGGFEMRAFWNTRIAGR
jgi:hypothetical protein